MEDGSFNCTEAEVDSLVDQVVLKQSSVASWNLLRRRAVCPSCQLNKTAEIEWVKNTISCTGNGAIARAYLADADKLNFEEVRCSITIPITTMALA